MSPSGLTKSNSCDVLLKISVVNPSETDEEALHHLQRDVLPLHYLQPTKSSLNHHSPPLRQRFTKQERLYDDDDKENASPNCNVLKDQGVHILEDDDTGTE